MNNSDNTGEGSISYLDSIEVYRYKGFDYNGRNNEVAI